MSSASILDQLRAGIASDSADTTRRIARDFAAAVPADHVLAFHGDLGAGKTTFIKGLAEAWRVPEPVTSPTFNLYTVYDGSRQLVHLDAYRLDSGGDLDALMIEDFLRSPWCLAVEWPERIADGLPEEAWHLHLEIDPRNHCHRLRLET